MNPYDVLGVTSSSTPEEIKKAYRKLAMEFHPDRNLGDPEAERKFKEVQTAYDTLTKAPTPQPGMADPFDIFNAFFGGHPNKKRRGSDIYVELSLTFMEAALGVAKSVQIDRPESCSDCRGEGALSKDIVMCESCQGSGTIQYRQGNMSVRTTCNHCGGRGKTVTKKCTKCSGRGKTTSPSKLDINVPAGVRGGDRVRLENQGEVLEGGAGDVYLVCKVGTHDLFERNGDDLMVTVPITYGQAILGDSLEIPTLDGKITIDIDPGTKTGDQIELSDCGFTNPQTKRKGNYVVTLEIDTPKTDDTIISLIKTLRECEIANPSEAILKFRSYKG